MNIKFLKNQTTITYTTYNIVAAIGSIGGNERFLYKSKSDFKNNLSVPIKVGHNMKYTQSLSFLNHTIHNKYWNNQRPLRVYKFRHVEGFLSYSFRCGLGV